MSEQAGRVPDRTEHWDHVYETIAVDEVSWYQRAPTTSLRLVESVAPGPAAAIIDVGGGASLLVDRLVATGFTDVSVLDVSPRALDAVRNRLGEAARDVSFFAHDVLTWEPERRYDVWHDRAVFHFLTEPSDRDRYVDLATRAVRARGALVIGTFAEDGPEQCSGLPVCRYAPTSLAQVFAPSFELVTHERESHRTPHGATQPFTWVVLRRVPPSST